VLGTIKKFLTDLVTFDGLKDGGEQSGFEICEIETAAESSEAFELLSAVDA